MSGCGVTIFYYSQHELVPEKAISPQETNKKPDIGLVARGKLGLNALCDTSAMSVETNLRLLDGPAVDREAFFIGDIVFMPLQRHPGPAQRRSRELG